MIKSTTRDELYGTTMIDIIGVLDPQAKTPTGKKLSLQKQLVERLQQAILSGRLPAGTRLSSTRALASDLGVSRNTVVLVYEQLTAEGFIIAEKQGTKVASLSLQAAQRRSAKHLAKGTSVSLATRWDEFAHKKNTTEINNASLAPGIPALNDFPLTAWRRSLERASKQLNQHLLLNHDPLGEPSLKQAIANHLHILRGVKCEPNQIVITAGAQQALDVCIALITDRQDTVWIEDPCYSGAKSVLSKHDLNVVPIPVDKDGINVFSSANLSRISQPRLIFTTPAHQYPTGAVLSVSRRLDLIEYAQKIGSWIIEDDYDGEFRHFGSPISSMQGLIENAPVIYIGSFSKTMYPSLKIGFMVLPKNLINQTRSILAAVLKSGNQIEQLALANFMTSGEFGRHLGRMKRIYRERQKVLRAVLSQHFPEDWILGGFAGMHLTLQLPSTLDDTHIAKKAQEFGIAVHALSPFYSEDHGNHRGLVIGYGNTHKDKIPDAVNIVSKLAALNTLGSTS